MKCTWIVENFTGDNGYEDLIAEVRKQGIKCIVLDITNYFEIKPEVVQLKECGIFQGSIQLFRKLKSSLSIYPLGWMTDPHYLCTAYWPHFQKFLFNDKHIFMSVAGLKANKWWVYASFAKDALIYIRPDGGDKKFTGRLLDLQDFDRFFADAVQCQSKDTDIVVVSSPKNIRGEWRFICTKDKEILACSLYKYNDQRTYIPSAPERATKLVKEILEVGWYPDPVFTIDIVEDMDGNYWMMEINSFTSAGTYAAPKAPIIKRVSEIAAAEWEEQQKLKAIYDANS
jgi:hypothetical protein